MNRWSVSTRDTYIRVVADRVTHREGTLHFWNLASDNKKVGSVAVFAPGGWNYYLHEGTVS